MVTHYRNNHLKNMLLDEAKYEKLKNKIEKHLLSYGYELEALKNLKLLSKKDGSPYKNPLLMFDIESLKKYFSKKYGFKFGCGSSLYLTESEFDYKINMSFSGIDTTLYLKKRVYLDECDEKTKKEKLYKSYIFNSYPRDYYNNDTPIELKEVIKKTEKNISEFANKEKQKLKALIKLKKDTISYLSKIDDDLFYRSEIASLIDY